MSAILFVIFLYEVCFYFYACCFYFAFVSQMTVGLRMMKLFF